MKTVKSYKNPLVFVVEDELMFQKLVVSTISKHGYHLIKKFDNAEDCIKEAENNPPDIVIQDYDLNGKMNGLDCLKAIKKMHPDTDFIFLSGQSKIEVAVEAIKEGAFDYIVKDTAATKNIIHKLKNLHNLNKLMVERNGFRKGMRFFIAILIISWVIFGLFSFLY